MDTTKQRRADEKTSLTAFMAVLYAGLLLFGGCKDLFHPEGPKQEEHTGGSNPTQYTVSYDANGADGTPPTAQMVSAGESLTLTGPGDLIYPGYTFGGWNTDADGTGTTYNAGDSYTPTASVTLYAKWTKYTVSFDADGGTPSIQTRMVTDSGIVGTLNMPSEPAKINYTFDGWYTVRNGGGDLFFPDTPVTGDITVYAKWKVIQYTVTFDADGGSPTGEQKTLNSGAWVGYANMPSVPAKSGSIFGGWYTGKNGGGSQFYGDTVVTGNMTVYAKWTLDSNIKYTVTFDADGGTPATETKQVTNGSFVGTDMPPAPTKGGFVFGGWYTAKNGGGTQFTAETTVIGDIRVYARWTAQYTVTFDVDDGSTAPQTKTVLDGNSVGVPNMPVNPTRTHYTFGGWYTAKNGGGTEFTALTAVTGNITVYAKWTIIQYTVTFNADGGNPAVQARMVDSGSSVGASNIPEPTRTGYTFDGWYTGKNGGGMPFTASTTVLDNITVYAKWMVTVTYNANGAMGTLPSAQTVTAGSSVTLAGQGGLTYVGYTFSGWSTNAAGTGTTYNAGTSYTPTGNIILYAKWRVTVTYHANGASGTPPAIQSVSTDGSVTVTGPGGLSYPGYSFNGWNTNAAGTGTLYNAGDSYTPTVSVTLYAQWTTGMPGNLPLSEVLTWISSNAVEGGSYTIIVKKNETISPQSLSYGDKNVSVTLNAGTMERTVSLSTTGALFTLESGVTLTLGNNITLQGRSDNTASLVWVNSGGALVMNTGSKISGNTSSSYHYSYSSRGGGVYVSGGTFTMNGGIISDNLSIYNYGGGVYVANGATFTMSGGTISGNKGSSYGGGVYVDVGGAFTMNSGTISSNITWESSYSPSGSGVYVSGTFMMQGGTISGNTTGGGPYYFSSFGGGVYVTGGGIFTMSGGTISGHTGFSSGGGVYAANLGIFTMSNGTISGNTAYDGGGVYVKGVFTMSGGIISGNIGSGVTGGRGGGVYVFGGVFTKQSGGIIYGSNASTTLRNTAFDDDSGHAVCQMAPLRKRNTTAGVGVTLDSTQSGTAGGWE
jgi:uncharacterized repeat protein (TIGR02543 family)